METQIGIEFVPQGTAILKFLKDLQSLLLSLKIDNSKLSIGDIEKEIEKMGGNVEELLPVFRLLANESDDFGNVSKNSILDFSEAIKDAEKNVSALIAELEQGEKITLPDAEIPNVQVPNLEVPEGVEIPLPKVKIPDIELPEDVQIKIDDGDIKGAVNSLEELRAQAIATAKAMEEKGDAGTEEYERVRKKIDELGDAINELKNQDNGGGIFEKIFQFEAVEKGAEFLGQIAEKGAETRAALLSLESSASATGVSLESLKNSAQEVFENKGAESYAEAMNLVAIANRNFGDTLKGQDLTDFTLGMQGVAKTLGTDVEDALKKSSSFVKAFGLSGEESFNLIALGAQKANTPQDDLIDTLSEYSPLLKNAGFSGEEFLGVLTEGAEEGVFNLDKIGDAIKETQIRLKAGDIENAFKDLGDVPENLQEKLNASLEKATSGEISVKDFLLEATKATNEANLTDAMKSKIQVAISGTPAEDIGEEIYSKIFGAPINTEQIKENALLAGEQIKNSLGNVSILDKITAGASVAFDEIAASLSPIAAPLGNILGTVGQIGPGLTLLEGKFALFSKLGGGLKDIAVKIISSVIPALGAQTVATGTATTATAALNTTMLLNPAFLIVTGIAALATAFILFSDDVKDAETAVNDVNNALTDFEKKDEINKATIKQSDSLRKLADEYDTLKNKTDPESQRRFAEVSEELAGRVPSSVSAIENLGNKSEETAKKVAISTQEIRSLADENERLASEARSESLENLGDQAAALAESYKAAKEEQIELREERDKLLEKQKEGLGDQSGLLISGDVLDTVNEQLKDVRGELGEVSGEVDKAENGMREFAKRMLEGGKSAEEIALMTGLTTDEIKRFTGETVKGKDGMKGIAGEAKGVSKNIDEAKKKAGELGKKFADAKKEIADFSSVSINALAQDLIDLQAAQTRGDKAAILAAQERVKISTQAARVAVNSEKDYENFFKKAQLLAGKIKPEPTQKKDVIDAAKEVSDVLFSLNNQLALQNKQALDAELEKIRQSEEAEKESLRKRAQTLRDTEKDKAKILKNKEQIVELEDGGKAFLAVESKYNSEREKAQRDFYTKLISEQAKFTNEAITQEIAELEFAESEITDTTETALSERLNLRLRKLALQQSIETRAIVDGSEEYISAFVESQKAIAEAEEINTNSEATEQQKIAANERVEITKKRLQETELAILQGNEKIKLLDAKFEKETLKSIEDIQKESYDKQVALLEKSYEKKARARERELTSAIQLVADLARISDEFGNVSIDTKESEKVKEIEREFELRLITEEEKQERLTAIQKDAESERLALQKQALGAQLEAERQAGLAELELQKERLQERLKLAEENGQTEEAENIGKQLADLEEQISEKGSFIVGVSSEIQTNITDIFSNLFNEDSEKLKQPFKNIFQVLSGGLTKLASAKVTQVILDSILPGFGLGSLIAALGARPAIEGLLNSLLQPLLQSLLSFPTGGAMVFNEPTLLQVGDGARLGGINREYIFRDDQLRETIKETVRISDGKSDEILWGILTEMKKIPSKFIITREELYNAVMLAKFGRN